MRLSVERGDRDWSLWDVKRAYEPRGVLWVDDQIHQWCELLVDDGWIGLGRVEEVHQEVRISIYPARRLVLFNEVDDAAPDEALATEEARDALSVANIMAPKRQLENVR